MPVRLHKSRYSEPGSAAKLRQKLEHEGYSVFVWSDSEGAVYDDHSHRHDEYIVVASGAIVFKIASLRYLLEAGDALELPANTVHAAVNENHGPVSYFICTRA